MISSPGSPGARTAQTRTGTVPPASAPPSPAPAGALRADPGALGLGVPGSGLVQDPQAYPPCPGHWPAWSGLFLLPGVVSRLWPGAGAQGLPCGLHLLEHGPERSRDAVTVRAALVGVGAGPSSRRGSPASAPSALAGCGRPPPPSALVAALGSTLPPSVTYNQPLALGAPNGCADHVPCRVRRRVGETLGWEGRGPGPGVVGAVWVWEGCPRGSPAPRGAGAGGAPADSCLSVRPSLPSPGLTSLLTSCKEVPPQVHCEPVTA